MLLPMAILQTRFPATTAHESPLAEGGARQITPERLIEAVAALRTAQRRYNRERAPLEWAMLQNNLGAALRSLGIRAADPQHLEEAVAAYQEALKEYRPERVPL